jgi:hypothetical protein
MAADWSFAERWGTDTDCWAESCANGTRHPITTCCLMFRHIVVVFAEKCNEEFRSKAQTWCNLQSTRKSKFRALSAWRLRKGKGPAADRPKDGRERSCAKDPTASGTSPVIAPVGGQQQHRPPCKFISSFFMLRFLLISYTLDTTLTCDGAPFCLGQAPYLRQENPRE